MRKWVFVFALFLSFCANAEEKIYQCGDDCTAKLDDNGVLRVSGTGAMWDYNWETRNDAPLYANSQIKKVVVEDGITSVGAQFFSTCSNIKTIELADSVEIVKEAAFDNIDFLESLIMSDHTIWEGQDELNSTQDSNFINVYCRGNLEKCKTNFMNTPLLKGAKFNYKGKRIYTIEEANAVAKPTGNTIRIKYR